MTDFIAADVYKFFILLFFFFHQLCFSVVLCTSSSVCALLIVLLFVLAWPLLWEIFTFKSPELYFPSETKVKQINKIQAAVELHWQPYPVKMQMKSWQNEESGLLSQIVC